MPSLARPSLVAGLALIAAAAPAVRAQAVPTPSPAPAPAAAAAADPLPSWNDGAPRRAILAFVTAATRRGDPGYLPPEARIAVFDNDGTLWSEQPPPEAAFALGRLREVVKRDPALGRREPYRSALAGDLAAVARQGDTAVVQLLGASHAGMSEASFLAMARAFMDTARHPQRGTPYRAMTYRPMRELLDYLRANGFQTWICSGGTVEFIRAVSDSLYGIPPQQVIGTTVPLTFVERDGRGVVWRERGIAAVNDKAGKPVGIMRQIGRRPALAAGNVRSGGDVQMLRFAQERDGPSLQLMIDHDDAEREFAYAERDTVSLRTARARRWTVVSMKRDWRTVYP